MRALGLGLAVWFCAAGAWAQDKPVFAPPPAWVKPTPMPTPKAATAEAPFRILLFDQQVNFGPDGDEQYTERAVKIQNAQALTGASNVSVRWNPEQDVVTVHKVQIRRGDAVTDILAKQTFTVLRRETGLEYASLDGHLTATLQPEDLQVGDILDVAYTVRHRDPAMQGRSNATFFGLTRPGVDRAVIRAIWSEPKAMTWKASGGMEQPVVRRDGKSVELVIERNDPQAVDVPYDAPARFRRGPQLELSQFATWADTSAVVSPLFEKASRLTADSPLKAEAKQIKAASSDPKTQAGLALSLVEERVRYLFLGMQDGGYVPADADLTWTRKFGDCKGKTVLLLALLRELNIKAEAALVASRGGDGMDERLPAMSAFDHVIVRATIGGKDYWLDGTRTGDKSLDRLRVPPFRWALPVRAQGASLVKMTPEPFDRPQTISMVRIDASAGLEAPAPIHVENVLRGDSASMFKTMFGGASAADREKTMRKTFELTYADAKITSVSGVYDEAAQEYRLIMDGVTTLKWGRVSATVPNRGLPIYPARVGETREFKREPGPNADLPVAVPGPAYTAFSQTIILPRGVEGFTLPAPDVDETIAGRTFHRRSRIEKGVATIETSTRTVAEEYPAKDAPDAAKKLTELAKTAVVLQAPLTYRATEADIGKEPSTYNERITRGAAYLARREYAKALADFDKAVELDPKRSSGYSNRGIAQVWLEHYDLAKADFAAAAKLNTRDPIIQHGVGLMAAHDGRLDEAVTAYGRAIDMWDADTFALAQRASLYRQLGEYDKALADLSELSRLAPEQRLATYGRIEILYQRDPKAALAEVDAALKSSPGDERLELRRASLLAKTGDKAKADEAFAKLVKEKPSVEAYLRRADARDKSDRAGRLADAEAALKFDPTAAGPMVLRADLRAEAGEHAKAVAELSAVLKRAPDDNDVLLARAKAYVKGGQTELARKDFETLRGRATKSAGGLNNLCWTRATLGFELESALVDCDASLSLAPQAAAVLDSRAFVLMRLGRYDEAVTAYDAALRLRPKQAASLYGRGMSKLRLQKSKEGQADIDAAIAVSKEVPAEFAGYGLKL